MTVDPPLSAPASRALDAVDDAARTLGDARSRVADLAARVGPIAADADWRAPSAHAFHERLDRWRALLRAAERQADDVADALGRARADIRAQAWAGPQ